MTKLVSLNGNEMNIKNSQMPNIQIEADLDVVRFCLGCGKVLLKFHTISKNENSCTFIVLSIKCNRRHCGFLNNVEL